MVLAQHNHSLESNMLFPHYIIFLDVSQRLGWKTVFTAEIP